MPEMPQGWYADPHQHMQQRWWDGTRWTEHTAPMQPAPATTVTVSAAEAARPLNLKTILVVAVIVLAITILTRSLGVILLVAGLLLLGAAIYALVKGSAELFRMRSRGAAWAALGIALTLMFVGSGANAVLGGPGSSEPLSGDSSASTAVDPKPLASTPTRTPSPSPIPTTFDTVEESTTIPFERTIVDDPQLDIGQTPITVAGTDGMKTTTYLVTYVNGIEESREVVSELVTVAPINEVMSNGTRQPAPAPVPLVQPPSDCHASYAGVCVPIASDVDCAGGSGDGPEYVRGPLQVVGPDVYKLDRDGDGIACD